MAYEIATQCEEEIAMVDLYIVGKPNDKKSVEKKKKKKVTGARPQVSNLWPSM